MRRLGTTLCGLAILSTAGIASAQGGGIRVTLLLVSPALPDSAAVFVAGGLPQLGEWDPGKVRLSARGNHAWSATIALDGPTSFEYKFTRGSWDREAADSAGAPLHNSVARVARDTTITTTVSAWTNGPRPRVLHGQITGTVRYHRAMHGAGLADRDVIVWLPPGYESNQRTRYPVLYMLDGQNVFDPATSSYGVDWAADETADSLIRRKAIAPLIIVGVYSTADRMKEYMPGRLGTAYLNFMVHTLKPFIDSTYRTRPDARHTMVGGSSAGGTSAFMLVWEHPEVFSRALCMSPAFVAPAGMFTRFDYVATVRATARPPKNVYFYTDIGGVGLEEQLRPGVEAMLEALEAKGYRAGRDFAFVRDSTAEHNEAAWAKRFARALQLVLR
jgi:enterochelin esterase-like enzyme